MAETTNNEKGILDLTDLSNAYDTKSPWSIAKTTSQGLEWDFRSFGLDVLLSVDKDGNLNAECPSNRKQVAVRYKAHDEVYVGTQ